MNMKLQDGFTLIELLLAMALFSFMLMIMISGFLNIIRLHQSGIISRTTQQDVRFGMEDMVRIVRAGSEVGIPSATSTPGIQVLCVINTSSSVIEFYRNSSDELMKVSLAACTESPSGGQKISSDNVVVKDFTTTFVAGSPNSVAMSLSIGGNNGSAFLGGGNSQQCDPSQSGSQFCSLTTISTAATPRGSN